MNIRWTDSLTPGRNGALLCYAAALLAVFLGVVVAFARFPEGYDFAYTVISKLASPRQNPEGARWLSGSLLLAVLLLWPVVNHLGKTASEGRLSAFSITALRTAIVGGSLLALEGIFAIKLSHQLYKAHEAIALVTFLGFYGGVLGLYFHRIRESLCFLAPALMVVLPLVAVGVTQAALYVGQRELGWVDAEWRDLGVPLWLSFAFWQWLAVTFLWGGLGLLVLLRGDGRWRGAGTLGPRGTPGRPLASGGT